MVVVVKIAIGMSQVEVTAAGVFVAVDVAASRSCSSRLFPKLLDAEFVKLLRCSWSLFRSSRGRRISAKGVLEMCIALAFPHALSYTSTS